MCVFLNADSNVASFGLIDVFVVIVVGQFNFFSSVVCVDEYECAHLHFDEATPSQIA